MSEDALGFINRIKAGMGERPPGMKGSPFVRGPAYVSSGGGSFEGKDIFGERPNLSRTIAAGDPTLGLLMKFIEARANQMVSHPHPSSGPLVDNQNRQADQLAPFIQSLQQKFGAEGNVASLQEAILRKQLNQRDRSDGQPSGGMLRSDSMPRTGGGLTLSYDEKRRQSALRELEEKMMGAQMAQADRAKYKAEHPWTIGNFFQVVDGLMRRFK